MKRSILICALVTLAFTITATAQMTPMKKGEELKKLDFLVGEWTTQNEMTLSPGAEPMKMSGVTKISWQLGDVWLKLFSELPMGPMGTMYGTAHITWDASKKMYVSYWIDNFTSMLHISNGNFDENGNLAMTEILEYEGTMYHYRSTWSKQDDGTVLFTVKASEDGENWMTGMKSVYTRK